MRVSEEGEEGGEQGHTVVFGTLNTQSADRQLTERTLIQRGCFDWTCSHCGLLEGCIPEWSEGGLGEKFANGTICVSVSSPGLKDDAQESTIQGKEEKKIAF